MSTVLRKRVGELWRVRSGAARTAVPPGTPRLIGATAGDGQVVLVWAHPRDGGSPITSYTITRNPGGVTSSAAASATSATILGLTNGLAYTFTVTAHNVQGSTTSQPTPQVTPTGSSTFKPDVSNTGVAIGLAGDTRPPVTLTLMSDATKPAGTRWIAATGTTGYSRLLIQSPQTIERYEFRNTRVEVEADDVSLVECYHHFPDVSPYPHTTSVPSSAVVLVGPRLRFSAVSCTANGRTAYPYLPVKTYLSQNNTGFGNPVRDRSVRRCNLFGFNDGYVWSYVDGDLVEQNWLHAQLLMRNSGFVKITSVTPSSGGTMTAGTYWLQVRVITKKTGTSLFYETIPNLVPTSVTVTAGQQIAVVWDPWVVSAGSGREFIERRLYVSTQSDPDLMTQYVVIPDGIAATSYTYTGSALTTKADDHPEDISKFGHGDGAQGGPGTMFNVLVRGNVIESWAYESPENPYGSGVFQGGSYALPSGGEPVYGNVRWEGNWCDGGGQMFNTYVPERRSGHFEWVNNRIGLRYRDRIKSAAFTSALTLWSNNVWDETGINRDGAGVAVTEGELVP